MKKIIIFSVITFCLIGFTVYAFGIDNDLFNAWNRRVDLQKAFPDKIGLEDWAREYGWKEDNSLFKYSPYYSSINEIANDNDNDKNTAFQILIESLQHRVDLLEAKKCECSSPVVSVGDYENGEWKKCCGYYNTRFYCLDDIRDSCREEAGDYTVYLWGKKNR